MTDVHDPARDGIAPSSIPEAAAEADGILSQTVKTSVATVPAGRTIEISGFELSMDVGIHDHERGRHQTLIVDLVLHVDNSVDPEDKISRVLCYDDFITKVRAHFATGRINLLETVAAQIGALALAEPTIIAAQIKVSKPNVISGVASVGVGMSVRRA